MKVLKLDYIPILFILLTKVVSQITFEMSRLNKYRCTY